MADPSQLPHELVLLVIEAACHTYVYSRAGWVASLCLVCRSVQNVVNPILYARLFIGEHNIAALDELSRSSNSNRLSLVREVFIDLHSSFGDDRDGDCIVSARFAFLARALIGVRVISGPSRTIEALSHWNPRLRRQLVSVFVTDTTDSWHATTNKHCFAPVLRSVDYLHIIIFMGAAIDSPGDLAFLRGTISTAHSLIFDLLSQDRELIATLKVESLILTLDNIVSSLSPTFQRLVLRPRCVFEESVRFITARLAAWANVKRDPRIFVDDDFVPILDEENNRWLYATLDPGDALEGEALWQRGRQL
ncbi:hypothetical protein EXIGLDRAFT_729211 [Exidia glandulosa HHB12029]|uniref:F-box domain-containing protein n=1 Tax=Exidia glandulosa HHB12029 TaxID=1314781 RepID=A0A165LM79_EXIGL|nr:hypothetical protein EXIGLDRAFT_729211 [Exidia glandulosa HHB12029]